ncbi:hypothetical protein [Vibrio cholerae]|uniref:hypothetical protein n=1 Tax=Vibrio cholerae TaxID=666 RepID=UPI001E5C2111|nr:hypothetical protein [Vibrio cholerae]EJB8350692.1 hypothetical protein [Vibrio cholerae]EJB8380173.1 hypothetical protein [Vibrio cholerae]MCD1195936.1 hypothetical protein [Vibrio cholerae]MCD1200110.1 hypothetical protein [Vibrio cholerae]HDZ9487755.1 hypothetical protein [Vibrio cholerae]
MSFELDDVVVDKLAKQHRWAATGVSDYPPRDPLVGQSRFFKRFQTFLHTVDHDDDRFAHVFAVEAEWGRGKSRLGHELVAQINDCSKGWFVRDEQGQLHDQQLFNSEAQDKYLALYIRYSQVASDYQNSDNWFAFGLYQALLPLATQSFDGSIQREIAKQAYERLMPLGFTSALLAEALQLDKQHSEKDLYTDQTLVVELVQAAYEVLKGFGVQYVLVVLDELETVAEAATFGLEDEQDKRLDGQAIRLIGKAIKEEDPRRKLPWLRYVALCSPLLGQQLREIQSVARRFELVELEHNAFADVSDYVASLLTAGKLGFDYPAGLVEAAYAMSGANFGWFNVVMANVDAVLSQYQQADRSINDVGELFEAVLAGSGRVAKHVLDKGAIEGIQTRDRALLGQCRSLLYGQLPVRLADVSQATELLALKNEDQEPIAAHYRKLSIDRLQCRQALEQAKFRRDNDEWYYPAVDQALSLDTLLDNLRTFSIKEQAASGDKGAVLLPLSKGEFKYLLSLLYDHPAIEFAADALWHKLVGETAELDASEATHIGPSVAMLLRLDLRYRSAQQNSLIFKDPSMGDGHEQAMAALGKQSSQKPIIKALTRVTGFVRLLDNNWGYDESLLDNKSEQNDAPLAILTEPRSRQGGLFTLEGFKLHPEGKALFAWVNNLNELSNLHTFAAEHSRQSGRTPVLALTASAHLMEQYSRLEENDELRDAILLHYVNPSEADQLERIGLSLDICHQHGVSLSPESFTAKFKNKLHALSTFANEAIHKWRHRLQKRGLIAWPLKVDGKLSQNDRDLLFKGWYQLAIAYPELNGVLDLQQQHGVPVDELSSLLDKLKVPGSYMAKGYTADEHAGLFTELNNVQRSTAQIPLFLARIAHPNKQQKWQFEPFKQQFYFAYVAETSITAKGVFNDWMWWCGELNLLTLTNPNEKQATWESYPRSRLGNAITEAQNWFSGNDQDSYKANVEVMSRVYGYGRINEVFAPLDKNQLGYATVEAKEQLEKAQTLFNALKQQEEKLGDISEPNDASLLAGLIDKRAEILALVAKVKPINSSKPTLKDAHILDLEDKTTSLYHRVEQACLFAEFVERSADRISNRLTDLINDVEADCATLSHFPKSLYTNTLRTIGHILDGALKEDASSATGKKEQQAGSDTLLHYLRKLDLSKAQDKLSALATEVGLNLYTEQQLPMAEIQGHILSSYRNCKDRFDKLINNLSEQKQRAQKLQQLLSSATAEYEYADDIAELPKLVMKLQLIEDAIAELPDDAESKRQSMQASLRNGQFVGLRDLPEELMKSARGQIAPIQGRLNNIENNLAAVKRNAIVKVNSWLPLLKPLLVSLQQPLPAELTLADVDKLGVSELVMVCDKTLSDWQNQGEAILKGTGLTLAEWKPVYDALSQNQEPMLTPEQQQGLVNKGIVKMRLTFASVL